MKNELIDQESYIEDKLESEEKLHQGKRRKFREEPDLIDKVAWGLFFLWAGVVLLLDSSGYKENFSWWKEWYSGWSVFFSGAGIIVLSLTIFRMMEPKYNRKIGESFILGLCLLGFGLSGIVQGSWFFIIMLFAIAASILYKAFIYDK